MNSLEKILSHEETAPQSEVSTNFKNVEAANDGAQKISEADAKIFEDMKRRGKIAKKYEEQFFADMRRAGK